MSGKGQDEGGLRAQRTLWADPGWRRWVLASLFPRLGGAMMPFALLLVGEAALGSFASGAWMTSAYAVGAAVASPFRGRQMDRSPLPGALRTPLLMQALLCGAMALAGAARAPLPVLLLLSLLLGVVPAGLAGAYRALLPSLLSPHQMAPAFAIDAVLIEVAWMGGPPLVGALALVHPGLSLAAIGAGALVTLGANRWLPARAPPPSSTLPGDKVSLRPMLRGMPLLVYVSVVACGVSWGAVDTALPPRLVEMGSRAELWGGLSALLSVTSALGGLIHASLLRPASAARALWRALVFQALWGGLLLPTVWMNSFLGLGGWLAAAGLFLAPLVGLLTYLLQQSLPADRQAEGFALYGACWALGIGAGSALTALLLHHASARMALVPTGIVPLMTAVAVALMARALRPGRLRKDSEVAQTRDVGGEP
ncbi:MFS transporter [Stigmatella aurantiaca]|uniref:Major facilitator superfamily MFS-1 transporter n=1 Tax=Stigmatella aurantiaca (strain DW4/3-1) TaxID=378806 RepID=Q099B9_STIAD|nr:MFS transporter [Stigmatella aurantiaca]ADO75568.1 Major facilitator superfamily MFS-1 transporter [Stigmatella aurantiaca DW4/3-1]EAU68355.1 putative integral membrane protein [Stigmatella aurantiaca DW4/3-1]